MSTNNQALSMHSIFRKLFIYLFFLCPAVSAGKPVFVKAGLTPASYCLTGATTNAGLPAGYYQVGVTANIASTAGYYQPWAIANTATTAGYRHAGVTANTAPPATVTGLQCEHLVTPIGIDAAHPRLSWQLSDNRNGARQTAYQIRVSTDSLTLDTKPLWTSGKINSANIMSSFSGKALQPFTRYYWSVEVWDKDGVKSTPGRSWFETGMLQQSNW